MKQLITVIMLLAFLSVRGASEICVDNLYFEIRGDKEACFTGYDVCLVERNFVDSLNIPSQINVEGVVYTVTGIGSWAISGGGCSEFKNVVDFNWVSIPHTICYIESRALMYTMIIEMQLNSAFPPSATCNSFDIGKPYAHAPNTSVYIERILVPEGTAHRYENAPGWKKLNVLYGYFEYPGLKPQPSLLPFMECDGYVFQKINGDSEANHAKLCYSLNPPAKHGKECVIPEYINYEGETLEVCEIGDEAFFQTSFGSIHVGDPVTRLGNAAFAENKAAKITGMNNVRNVGTFCFASSNLRELKYPEQTPYVPTGCFSCFIVESGRLDCLELHGGIDSIPKRTFWYMTLEKVICHSIQPPKVTHDRMHESFAIKCTFGTLYVPKESVELYRAATGWKEFSSILPIESTNGCDSIECDTPDYRTQIFTITGMPVNTTQLAPGVYIKLVNGKATKFAVQ